MARNQASALKIHQRIAESAKIHLQLLRNEEALHGLVNDIGIPALHRVLS